MKKSTVWKILFKDSNIKQGTQEEMDLVWEVEQFIQEDPKITEVSERIRACETSTASESSKKKELKKLYSEHSRVRRDVIVQALLSKALEARHFWSDH